MTAKNRLRGRFSGEIDKRLEKYSSSLKVDSEMIAEDIWTNQAHTLMLIKQKIIDAKTGKKILTALEKIQKEKIEREIKNVDSDERENIFKEGQNKWKIEIRKRKIQKLEKEIKELKIQEEWIKQTIRKNK